MRHRVNSSAFVFSICNTLSGGYYSGSLKLWTRKAELILSVLNFILFSRCPQQSSSPIVLYGWSGATWHDKVCSLKRKTHQLHSAINGKRHTKQISLWVILITYSFLTSITTKRPSAPITLQTDETAWTNKSLLRDIPPGWYWVIFCISFETLNLCHLSCLQFNADRRNGDGQPSLMVSICSL
jgi:hypothetical protein